LLGIRNSAAHGKYDEYGHEQVGAMIRDVREFVKSEPSVSAVGAPFDNAMVEAFWARMQVELLNRRRWKTRVELASAIHDYIEIWHNTRRRHSALNMLTPTEFENQHQQRQIAV
jgi:transposase InsO family protein